MRGAHRGTPVQVHHFFTLIDYQDLIFEVRTADPFPGDALKLVKTIGIGFGNLRKNLEAP